VPPVSRQDDPLGGKPDDRTQASKLGYEGFSDVFAVKDRFPRFDVMLAPAMSPGSVRALLPTRALFASMLHRSFARPRGAPLLFVVSHWYAARFPCAISVRCRVHAVDVAIGWARRLRLFEGCWSHGAALAVASTSVVHVHAEPHAPMHAPSASMHSHVCASCASCGSCSHGLRGRTTSTSTCRRPRVRPSRLLPDPV
jgi:hypothetical protein